MVLLIDNYDSFVHNLARYFNRLGQQTLVVRNDAMTVSELRKLRPQAIILSPGPCTPDEAGISLAVVRELLAEYPIFGVCLGHQTIAQALGATIIRAPEPMHGRTSEVLHGPCELFAGLPSPLTACRYHSLVVDPATFPAPLEVIAKTRDDIIMAIQHRQYPVCGVQFHPEAILTEGGLRILANFLRLAGIAYDPAMIASDELPVDPAQPYQPPLAPVTF